MNKHPFVFPWHEHVLRPSTRIIFSKESCGLCACFCPARHSPQILPSIMCTSMCECKHSSFDLNAIASTLIILFVHDHEMHSMRRRFWLAHWTTLVEVQVVRIMKFTTEFGVILPISAQQGKPLLLCPFVRLVGFKIISKVRFRMQSSSKERWSK